MGLLPFTTLLVVAAFLSCIGSACRCLPRTPAEIFTSEGVASVHRVKALVGYAGPNGESLYKVENVQTFKGCSERPSTFVVENRNKFNS